LKKGFLEERKLPTLGNTSQEISSGKALRINSIRNAF